MTERYIIDELNLEHRTEDGLLTVFRVQGGATICKFSEEEYAIFHFWPNFFDDQERSEGVFRGKVDNTGFYETRLEALQAIRSGNIGGPDGDLDLDDTDRPYETVGIYIFNPWFDEPGTLLPDPYFFDAVK